jgi:hypothetical protein
MIPEVATTIAIFWIGRNRASPERFKSFWEDGITLAKRRRETSAPLPKFVIHCGTL